MTQFPLEAILFWIAVTLAPQDTSQILVKGPDTTLAWTRQSSGWSSPPTDPCGSWKEAP